MDQPTKGGTELPCLPQERYRDEIDAVISAKTWLHSLIKTHAVDEFHTNPGEKAGGTMSAWRMSRLVAFATILRDDMNWAIVVKVMCDSPQAN